MSYLLPVYMIFFLGLALAFVFFAVSRSDEARPRKWAKVRVWVDDNRKQRMQPPSEELDAEPRADWLIYIAVFLVIIMIMEAVN